MGITSANYSSSQKILNKVTSVFLAMVLALMLCATISQNAIARPAFSAITVDAATGKIIYGKSIDAKRYPASLTKVMTLYIMFEEIRAGRMSFSTRMKVSRKASLQQPSKLGLRTGTTIRARDAMYALITKSANDAAMVVAEHISGSQKAFGRRMTRTARALGMTRTTFTNPNGLPDRRQTTTARDMATLGLRIQRDFPKYYKYFKTKSFKYGKRRYGNHNRLLGRVKGVDGIKTGYTRASGFNLLSSRWVNGRRIVGVVMGGRSGRARNAFMTKILKRDLRKAIRSKKRIATVAGTPPGYRGPSATPGRKIAKVQKPSPIVRLAKAPIPRAKPAINPAADQLQIAAIVKSMSDTPIISGLNEADRQEFVKPTITEEAIAALPAQGVTFTSVVVPSSAAKSDSLIVANAAQALAAPSPAPQKNQDRLTITQPVAGVVAPTNKVEGTKIIRDRIKVEEKLAQHRLSWNIQVGAFPTQEGAKSRIDDARASKVRILKTATPFLMAVDKNGGTIYRARFSGLSRKQARSACRQLKRAGVGCFPLAPTS